MLRNPKFWISMAVFQAFFGFAVFAITRDYYQPDPPKISAHPGTISRSASSWQGISEDDVSRLAPQVFGDSATQDPAEISRQADALFAQRKYDQAASRYRRLLEFDAQNVEVHNNLGLTLHYLGRSDEALRYLDKGASLDATNQRIWLTLGYVNSQLGNVDEAREALNKATQIGNDESIRRSAQSMLDGLPD